MLTYFLISCLLIYTEGHPKYRRHKRDDDVGGITYAPCKDTYSQCPEWKKSGMCDMPQYKDYMPLVCTDTCGFCKEVKEEEKAELGGTNTARDATPGTSNEYQDQLQKYYESIAQQQQQYQATIQLQYQPTDSNPTNAETGSSNTESATYNSVVQAPAAPVPDVSAAPASADVAASPYAAAYGNPAAANAAYNPYGAQPNPYNPYGSAAPYGSPAPDNSSSSSSSSSSSGSKSSSSSSTSSDSSSGTSISVSIPAPLNSTTNQTEASGNVSAADASSLPSKVAPETPSLPALPPLLVLPPISESLLVDDSSKSNASASVVDKETSEKQKAAIQQQAADAKPYPPERGASAAKSEGSKEESVKETSKDVTKEVKVKHKSHSKSEPDRKVITEDQSTNEMTKSESKHLAVTLHGHNLDEGNEDEEEEGKMIKAFSDDPGKLQMNKGMIKKKNVDIDLKDTKQKSTPKRGKTKSSENEDAVYKHDEKSVSVSGSGAGGLEESFEDLNYITDFNPDDFDMDVPDISHKIRAHPNDKRTAVELPKDHPLFSRSGIQKARSEITAPTIIDATEHGLSDGYGDNEKDHIRSKIHARAKISSTAAPKADIKEAKEEASSGRSDDDEGSGEASETKASIKEETKPNKNAEKKSKTKDKKDSKKNLKQVTNENSETSELMSEKGDTAAVRNKKAEKKSKAMGTKKLHKVTERKEIPKTKPETEVANKRAKTPVKTEEADTSIADLSGAGSGEVDTDILSGETPFRSNIASGEEAQESSEDDEEEGEDEEGDDEEPAHQRQNFQLNGDPEMVDLKPKATNPQPDLNDFPDKVAKGKSSYAEDQEASESDAGDASDSSEAGAETGKDDEGELDDLKIEELLDPENKKKKGKSKSKGKKEKAKASIKEGKISLVLSQNYNQLYDKKDSPSYQMLAGNVKKDIEKMVKGTSVKDVGFSEVSVEGNPRQSGKTKASFNIEAPSNDWMKKLLKLVDSGDIDGLKVIKGSLEIEEE